jgi:hypothetical protein
MCLPSPIKSSTLFLNHVKKEGYVVGMFTKTEDKLQYKH